MSLAVLLKLRALWVVNWLCTALIKSFKLFGSNDIKTVMRHVELFDSSWWISSELCRFFRRSAFLRLIPPGQWYTQQINLAKLITDWQSFNWKNCSLTDSMGWRNVLTSDLNQTVMLSFDLACRFACQACPWLQWRREGSTSGLKCLRAMPLRVHQLYQMEMRYKASWSRNDSKAQPACRCCDWRQE